MCVATYALDNDWIGVFPAHNRSMLLIGSRAAQFHWADFRQPNDWDFICLESELHHLEQLPGIIILQKRTEKCKYKLQNLTLEVEIADQLPSSMALLNREEFSKDCRRILVRELNRSVSIASPETLLLLKRSHLPFRIHWRKNFLDYSFIKKKINKLPLNLLSILDTRIMETKNRIAYREHNFKLSNEKFLTGNIKRIVPHDNLHQMIKFYERPMFEYIKKDLSKAEIDYQMFRALPYEKQLANMAEEVMALALERIIIPAEIKQEIYSERHTKFKLTSDLCCNYLPFEFRFWAIDHFYQIVDFIPDGFSKPVVSALQKEIEEARRAL